MTVTEFTEVERLRNEISPLINAGRGKPRDYPWTPTLLLQFEAAVRHEATKQMRDDMHRISESSPRDCFHALEIRRALEASR